MSAIDALFRQLRAAGRKAFMPFVTAGDPDLDFTAEVIRRLAGRGCSLCELGIPYSDPIADGPVIQASYTRALEQQDQAGRDPRDASARTSAAGAGGRPPLVTMVSYAIVFRHGLERTWPTRRRRAWPGRSCPTCPWKRPARWPKSAAARISRSSN